MPCELYASPDGEFVAICCSRGKRKAAPCHYCGEPHTSLCDFPIGNGRTCDKPMCDKCRNYIGLDLDVCHEHNNPKDIVTTLGR